MRAPKATLLIPGYIASSPSIEAAELLPEQFNAINDAEQVPWQAQLCQALGWTEQQGDRLPSLSLPVGADNGELADVNSASLVHADPIHLKADRDTASIIPPEQLQLSHSVAQLLTGSINKFLENDGVRIHQCNPDAWMISGMPAHQLAAYPTSFVAHRHASAFLPDSDDDGTWRRLMTEIQMLLHAHPVNQEREQAGQMSVNALWFWGGARLPASPLSAANNVIFTDDSYAVALAEHWDIELRTLQELTTLNRHFSKDEGKNKDVMIVDTSLLKCRVLHDVDQYADCIKRINEHYLVPLSRLVLRGHLSELKMQTEDGLLALCTNSSRRWWQKWPWMRK